MKYGWSGRIRNTSFNKESAVWFLGRCYHHKMSPHPSMENSTTELTDMMTKSMTIIDNKMHEEQPTSSEIYLNSPTSPSSGIDECAIEPAEETGQDVAGNYEDGLEGFKKDFVSRIWMTYRKDFEAMSQTNDLSSPNRQEYTTGFYTFFSTFFTLNNI